MAAAAVRGAARALPSLALAYADGHAEVRWLKCASTLAACSTLSAYLLVEWQTRAQPHARGSRM
jgi:hypothetical protein